jgi:hypothetical protein
MMSIILASAILLLCPLWASDISEEAIILNQELQFLEDSVNNVKIFTAVNTSAVTTKEESREMDDNLEKRYFGNELEDAIKSKTAAPRRIRSRD